MKIEDLPNSELLEHFVDAVCDNHYNPSGGDYNKSDFSLHQLRAEILRRMPSSETEDDY